MKIAIVTGASSGLGMAFVRRLDALGGLDEIWGVARRGERLEALAAELRTPMRPLALDLTRLESVETLRVLMREEEPEVAVLVNAAGFGKFGTCADLTLQETCDMIDLNCRAAVAVTNLCLPYLTRGSRVLEICSTAAFQPMPGIGVYAATKAFLHSYAKTLHYELLPRGIHVTAVCPYWVKDTEFIPIAQEGKPGQFRHFPLASRSKSVVKLSLAASAWNLWVATPGLVCTLHRVGAKFIPHALMVPLMGLLRRV